MTKPQRRKPWMKFYPSDWRADPRLRVVSLAARGLWIECMCIMHEAEPYGHLIIDERPVTEAQLAALTGTSEEEVAALLNELESAGVYSRNRRRVIYSRRMTRDEKMVETARKNGKNGGNPNLKRMGVSDGKYTAKSPQDNPPDKPPDKGGDKAQRPEARGQRPESPTRREESGLVAARDGPDVSADAVEVGRAFLEAVGRSWEEHEAVGGHYGEVRQWLNAGYSREEIMAVAGRRQDLADKRGPLAYAGRLMAEEVVKIRQERKAQGDAFDRKNAQWRQRVRKWTECRFWLGTWGPEPDQPGCLVPTEVLAEFGLAKEAAE